MGTPAGFTGAGAYDVMDALRLNCGWYGSGLETSGQLGSVINACLAVASGLANHVLCFRSVWEGSAQGDKGRAGVMPGGGGGGGGGFKASGFMSWNLPFSAPSAAIWIAMFAQRHFHEYGTTREQMAWIALNARRNAALNPNAIYRDPMSMDDYMNARMISTPFCLYDCDVPCDGATAVIVSRRERAQGPAPPAVARRGGRVARSRPAVVGPVRRPHRRCRTATRASSCGSAPTTSPPTCRWRSSTTASRGSRCRGSRRSGLCGVGESGPFIEGGERIARDGVLPLNTHGGQLSAGRLHGYGFLHEGATQMWGEAGDRQIATPPEVGVIGAGGGNTCGCLLLVRE